MTNAIYECVINKNTTSKPIWFMRQAGRYLPEFRKIRKLNPNFINLCLNENLSYKITLQPLQRFKLDAAIIFSDILMIPHGLNQEVKFKKNFGPELGSLNLDKVSNINEITFLKTHSALCTFENNPFTNKSNTKAVIYVVRDPRNIVTSVLNHYSFKNIEESFDFIAKDRITITGGEDIVQYLGTWQQNYKSWRDLKFAPVLVVKYEDLINRKKTTILKTQLFKQKSL